MTCIVQIIDLHHMTNSRKPELGTNSLELAVLAREKQSNSIFLRVSWAIIKSAKSKKCQVRTHGEFICPLPAN